MSQFLLSVGFLVLSLALQVSSLCCVAVRPSGAQERRALSLNPQNALGNWRSSDSVHHAVPSDHISVSKETEYKQLALNVKRFCFRDFKSRV